MTGRADPDRRRRHRRPDRRARAAPARHRRAPSSRPRARSARSASASTCCRTRCACCPSSGSRTSSPRAAIETAELAYFNRHGQRDLARAARPRRRLRPPAVLGASRRAAAAAARRRRASGSAPSAVVCGTRSPSFDEHAGTASIAPLRPARRARARPSAPRRVLVGADGIHSRVRAAAAPDEGPPRYAGRMLWRATHARAALPDGPRR